MTKLAAPQLSSRRPQTEPSISSRLASLDSWTEQPTMTALDALDPRRGGEDAEILRLTEPAEQGDEKREVNLKVKHSLPWEGASLEKLTVFMFKPSEALHLKLKFLGETTYGMTMQKIVVEAVEAHVAALLEGRGIKE